MTGRQSKSKLFFRIDERLDQISKINLEGLRSDQVSDFIFYM